MPEPIADVNSESSPEQEVKPETEATVPAASEQETTETNENQQPPHEAGQPSEAVDEFGVPWKNRAMEWQRKFTETTESIPKMVEDALAKKQPQQQQYTIAQLEQYASDNPHMRPWVEEEKAKIIQNNVAKVTEEKVREAEMKQRGEAVKAQSFQWAMNHPRLQECFVVNPLGQKMWNPSHPLTQMIGSYMNVPEIKTRPDAIVVASKLALADYLDFQTTQSQAKNKKLQQNLKKVQKQTLVEGGGSPQVPTSKDSFSKAKEQLARTGSKKDAQVAVTEYLRSIGAIGEET